MSRFNPYDPNITDPETVYTGFDVETSYDNELPFTET